MTQVVLFNVFNGLIVGAFYALMALGLSLILNLSGVINFAHGGFLALGAYLAYTLTPYLGFWGALVVAPLITAALGLVVERVLIRPLYGGDPLYGLLVTFGLAYIFEDMTRTSLGRAEPAVPGPRVADDVALEPVLLRHRLSRVHDRHRRGRGRRAFRVLNYTRLGMRIRAGTRDLDTVSTLGRQRAPGSAASTSASASTSPVSPASWRRACSGSRRPSAPRSSCRVSWRSSWAASAACSARLLGGLMIGVASGLAAVYFPSATEAVIYVMMGLVLLIRPRGLLGEEGRVH